MIRRKKNKKLKVFHGFSNYGTQAGLFALELRNAGIDAISVTKYDRFKRQTDIELLHGGNFISKLFKHAWNGIRLPYWFFKYNTFHFYFGSTLVSGQWDLPLYRLFKKKLVFEYLGGDVTDYTTVVKRYNLPSTHRFARTNKEVDEDKKNRIREHHKYGDIQLVCAPCYAEYVPGSKVLPLGVDLSKFSYVDKDFSGKLIIMHAPTDMEFKGSVYILDALNQLVAQGYPIEINLVKNVTHNELIAEYSRSHIFIDQISIGWYGTAAVEAMATGCPTACFIDELYLQYIDFASEIPITNISKEHVYQSIKTLIDDREKLKSISLKSREFVENIHDIKTVTHQLIHIYHAL
jgi:glycosyltransferase involved in cell wall biosynthesis